MSNNSLSHVKDFETTFLLLFTEEMIRATQTYKSEIIKKNIKVFVAKKEQQQKQVLQLKKPFPIEKIPPRKIISKKQLPPFADFFAEQGRKKKTGQIPIAAVEETDLPPHLRYLKPIPSSIEIDLKKIMPLIKDPLVRIIECNGNEEKIIVMGGMGRKSTPISLTKEEISEIINIFSNAAKIPVSEGIYKVVYGKLLLSAIVSEVVGSRFIIRKMDSPQPFSQRK